MRRRFLTLPIWVALSTTIAGLAALGIVLVHRENLFASSQVQASTLATSSPDAAVTKADSTPPAVTPYPEPGKVTRRYLSYDQWVAVLRQEARVIAAKRPSRLAILAGDSLSLWFPQELLPTTKTWLNQGISGETSYGLLRRVKLFDQTAPDIVFVMIGINDLIRGVREVTLIANQQEIIRHIKQVHPTARIVVQSILPHGGQEIRQRYLKAAMPGAAEPIWVNRLTQISNDRIRRINRRLAEIAALEKAEFLDLHTHFIDQQGNLAAELSTDGLHLSQEGYRVWRSHLDSIQSAPVRSATRPR